MWLKLKQLALALLLVNSVASANEPSGNFSLDKDECIILVASTKSETEAQALAKKYPGSELYTSKSGYIAVGLEKISKPKSAARIKELLSAGKIPKDSNCADGTRITGLFSNDSAGLQGRTEEPKNNSAVNSKNNILPDALSVLANKKWSLGDLPCNLNGGTYTIYTNLPPSGASEYLGGRTYQSEQMQDFELRASATEKNIFFRRHTVYAKGNKLVTEQVGDPNTIVSEVKEKITLQGDRKLILNIEIRQIDFNKMLSGRVAYTTKLESSHKNLCN